MEITISQDTNIQHMPYFFPHLKEQNEDFDKNTVKLQFMLIKRWNLVQIFTLIRIIKNTMVSRYFLSYWLQAV